MRLVSQHFPRLIAGRFENEFSAVLAQDFGGMIDQGLLGSGRAKINIRGQTTLNSLAKFHRISRRHRGCRRAVRDVFGKPLTLARSGIWSGLPISATRQYVYDTNQRLCKRIEPETGATLMDYDAQDVRVPRRAGIPRAADGANNIAWTATGSTLTTPTCDRASVVATARRTRTCDLLNRPLTVDVPNSTKYLLPSLPLFRPRRLL